MKARQLIEFFSMMTNLPVDVNAVADHICDNGIEDIINFVGVDYDPGILRATLARYVRQTGVYAEVEHRADVYYSTIQTIDWQRLVCVKEMIHLLDGHEFLSNTRENVDKLIEKIVLPFDLRGDIAEEGWGVWSDRLTEYIALTILFPYEARAVLLEKYRSGVLTDDDIAQLVCLPLRYIKFIMSEHWEEVYKAILEYLDVM